ncbi:MAG: hypothetical protein RR101_13275 [Burkholderiaceae bacterium]
MSEDNATFYRRQVAIYERAELEHRLRAHADEERRHDLLVVADLYRAEADKLRQII